MIAKRSSLAYVLFLVLVYLSTISCVDVKKSIYFYNQQDTSIESHNEPPLTVIQTNDILSITVSSLNPEATALFNTPNNAYTTTSVNGSSSQSPGYLVNKDGYVQFPILGNIKALGLTTIQLKDLISKSLVEKKLLVDPVVVVRQLNFKVSVLGEVARPSVLNVVSEKISLLEALGLAGDVTIFGRKDNIMVIREESGKKIIKRLNLNSKEFLLSDYYYLKSNDVIYVEANKAKINSSGRTTQFLPILLSGLSFIAIIVSSIIRK